MDDETTAAEKWLAAGILLAAAVLALMACDVLFDFPIHRWWARATVVSEAEQATREAAPNG